MVKTSSNECSMILVLKVFLTRVLGWSVPMWLKGLTLEGEIVRNPNAKRKALYKNKDP